VSDASVSIDRALLGAGYTEDVRVASLGGAVVRVRVLSPTELQAICVSLADITEKSGELAFAGIRSRTLHAACSMPDGSAAFASVDAVLKMPPEIVRDLWRAYERGHRRTYSVDVAMQDAMDERAQGARIETLRARHAAGLVAFYGLRCALDATTAQVLWFGRLLRGDGK